MKEILCKQSKETRCYIMSIVMVFEGYNQINEMTELHGEMLLDVLGLSREEIERFPMPKDFSQIVAHLKPISDPEVRHWIIRNSYSPVLKSRRRDALRDFRTFCSALEWDAKEIKETMELTEELDGLKPIDGGGLSSNFSVNNGSGSNTGSGCLSVIALIIVSTLLCSFILL